ncbi:MAG: Rrf2 family transcriptional regulator [Firmicutes bacterium]|nr:Rrf2 family transcriptional regulator [Bacillota bacterium]
MEITKKAEYAVTILIDLATQPEDCYVTAREIADRQGIPRTFVPQIISILSKAGWVEGMRGPGGGVRAITDLHELSVLDIIETVEGPIAITRCLMDDTPPCENRPHCPLRGVWIRAQDAMLEVLKGTTVVELVEIKQQLVSQTKITA